MLLQMNINHVYLFHKRKMLFSKHAREYEQNLYTHIELLHNCITFEYQTKDRISTILAIGTRSCNIQYANVNLIEHASRTSRYSVPKAQITLVAW